MSLDGSQQRAEIIDLLRAFAALDSELGRLFARNHRMHPTDASAIVEIIIAEQHGRTLTPARLAQRIGLTTGATSTLLGRLETAGHVVRTHDHTDRRIVTLHSTQAIHDAASQFFTPIAEELDGALSTFSMDELATAKNVTIALHAAISDAKLTAEQT